MLKKLGITLVLISHLLTMACGSIGETVDINIPDECQESADYIQAFANGIDNHLQTKRIAPQDTNNYGSYSGQAQECFALGHISAVLFAP